MAAPASGQLIGRYLLFGEIAAGGMAAVHFGRLSGPAGFSRTVAIKRLHVHLAKDPEFVSMFLDEARLAARVRHPNVVPTLDVVATDGEIFLVMEYVQGESLARLLRAVRAMMTPADVRIVATVMANVLHGLHAAHEARSEQGEPLEIVHRDVSPQNVLVGVDGVPRVLDFGVAKAAGRLGTTKQGEIKGKISYMPPEQLHGGRVTRQSDVYSAAVVTWEALTGKRLFYSDNEAAVVTAILQAPIRAPSEVASHVPPAFDRVVMRGLERDPARRYATAREMAVELERCVGIVSASQIGEWVESLAHDELLKRASRMAEIESVSSSRPVTLPATSELPTMVASSPVIDAPPRPVEVRSDVSSIAVSPILSPPPRRSTHRVAIAASVVGAAVVIGGVVLALALRGGPAAATGEAPPAGPVAPVAAASTEASASAPPPAAPAETDTASSQGAGTAPPTATATASAAAGGATAAPRAAPSPTPRTQNGGAPPRIARPAARPAAQAAPDCDPPFTIDERGHKHYKPACVQ
jgi:serine/threonine-protein kinase